jgi:hypothetical protein
MKKLKLYQSFLNEKSSLSEVGLPREVLYMIERDYQINPNAQWLEIPFKEVLAIAYLKYPRKHNLFLQITPENIYIFSSYGDLYKNFILDEFKKRGDDFGEFWEKIERQQLNLNQIANLLDVNYPILFLKAGHFQPTPAKKRKLDQLLTEYEEIEKVFFEDLKKVANLSDVKGDDGLSDLKREVFNFEEAISDFINKPLNIVDLINIYGRKTVKRFFLYYLKTRKLPYVNLEQIT